MLTPSERRAAARCARRSPLKEEDKLREKVERFEFEAKL
jgi:hypothetical protein